MSGQLTLSGSTLTVTGNAFSVGTSTFVVKAGNVGIGTTVPGAKLEIAGQVKITGGDPGTNKVLTSDNAGLASWKDVNSHTHTSSDIIDATSANTADMIVKRDGSGNFSAGTITASLSGNATSAGNADTVDGYHASNASEQIPISNGTVNTNLNADLLDGQHYSSSWPNPGDMVTGSGTANYISKWTGTYTQGNSIIFDNGTNVGIGTTSPGAKLEVAGAVKITGSGLINSAGYELVDTDDTDWIRWNQGSGSANGNAMYQSLSLGTGGLAVGDWSNQGVGNIYATGILQIAGTGNSYISGNVGIGTTSPGYKLDIANIAAQSTDALAIRSTDSRAVWIRPSMGAGSYNPLTQAGDSSIIYSAGSVDTGALVIAQWSNSARGIRIDSSGNVGIGTTSLGYKLTVSNGGIGGNYALLPSYANWNSYGTGDGGAAIYNDSGDHKKLMIVGNNSGSAVREIGMWDNVTIAGNLTVSGSVSGTITNAGNADTVDGYHASNASGQIPVSNGIVNTNLNADLLDGIDSSGYTRSDIFSEMDFNNLTTNSRVTSINANANTPFGEAWYTVINNRHRGGVGDGNMWGSQIAIGMTTYQNKLAFRTHNAGTWSSWSEIWSSGNDGPGSGLDADTLDGYSSESFDKSPDGWSGSSISGNITLSDTNPYIYSGGSYIIIPYGAYFSGGTVYITNQIQARGGIHNDIATYLQIDGGTNGDTYFSGSVGIGLKNPQAMLHLVGGAYSDGNSWVTASDRSYKKDIDYDFNYGLDEINKLQPVYYVYKSDKDNKRHVGFIAQDMIKVIPEVVSGQDGSFGLDYGALTAVLTSAIKEQQEQIKELKTENDALKARIEALESKIK
ncbi:MAG: hypothetical protein GX445_00970 [Elusimicrobia bacterium]|nr:hypothetical protein [Elusimicrobiota bacterium]